jgi:OOP family OmpA-OmpF porin
MVGADDRPTASGDEDVATLRALLIGPEQARLAALQARLDDRDARAEEVATVLPQVLLQHADDPHLTRALSPPLERAITQSVQRNPQPLADALFPVMGPAIRKAVAAGLAGMVESLNRTLELALSPRSIRWRFEAVRTGKPFAEIVLLKTLVYRVEQVFLIERQSGLLLQHVEAAGGAVKDADMVSGMLTAIRDFVHDSFRVSSNESLEALQVGELAVWIEAGPSAIVAAVIRGTAPRELRRVLQDAVETVHLQFAPELDAFAGDASVFEGSRPTLEGCLQTQLRAGERRPSPRGARVVAALAAVAAIVWIAFAVRDAGRRQRYLEALDREPGLVVVSTSREGGRLVVQGLRDPVARDPVTLVAGTGLAADDVDGRWAPYLALDPEIVQARAAEALQPPAGVTLALADGVLRIEGAAPAAWIAEARRRASAVPGVRAVDAAPAAAAAGAPIVTAIEAAAPLFRRGSSRLADGQDDVVARLVIHIRELDALATAAGVRFAVEIAGHTDADGPDESNLPLSRARAELVRAAIAGAGLPGLDITTRGASSAEPAATSADDAAKQLNRRVSVRVSRARD